MGGLSAAIRLGAAGLDVLVVEAAERAGGKAGIVEIDGVEVDTGPSVLTLPDVLDDLLRVSGSSLEDELALIEPSPAFRYIYPDGQQVDVHVSLERTLASVERSLGAQPRRELESYLAASRRIWESAEPWFVRGPAPSFGRMLDLSALRALSGIDAHRPLWRAIAAPVRSRPLRWLLARYATYNGSDPRHCPATLGCIAWVELGLGAYGVRGGMYAVVRSLLRAAERVGVELRTSCRVQRVCTEAGAVSGVRLAGGEHIRARRVVCNADAAHLAEDLLAAAPRRLQRLPPPSMSGWVGIARVPRAIAAGLAAHMVIFPEDYLEEFADIFDRDRPPRSPTVYLCVPELAFERPGWEDSVPVFAMANAPAEPRGAARPTACWESLAEAVKERLERSRVLPRSVPWLWERSPGGLATAFPGTRGAIYGGSSNSTLAAFRRPPNRVPGLEGLYLASGSAHPGGGVPLCLLSGGAAAACLLADERPEPSRIRGAL